MKTIYSKLKSRKISNNKSEDNESKPKINTVDYSEYYDKNTNETK